MYQKSCKNGSSSHLSEEASTASAMACNNDESAVDRLISEKAKVGNHQQNIDRVVQLDFTPKIGVQALFHR